MTPEQAVTAVLETVDGLAGKVFPAEALKNAAAPFAFYLLDEDSEREALDGPTGLCSATLEVHCVARNYGELVAMSAAVRSALRGMQGQTFDGMLIERATVRQRSPDIKEVEVNLYRRMYVLQLDYQGGN